MDGRLKKELKKLEHDYSNENTLRLGDFYRNHSAEQLPRFPSGREVRWRELAMGTGRRFKGILFSDWAFLALLGVFVAGLSVSVDQFVSSAQILQQKVVSLASMNLDYRPAWLIGISYSFWIIYTTGLVLASATFVHAVSPQAIGSGIPEMKTIIRGVILRDYLTFKTLISKTVGLALTQGSGIPIGTCGPFVHIASVVANQMSLVAGKFDPVFLSESRRAECLVAACAVGVACTFSSPVGGVLFSIEVTTMYFSVRSYWRGFFAACCGATTIRLLRGYVSQTEVTVNAFFQTSFKPDAFGVHELPIFILLGAFCGVFGAGYIRIYRAIVLFLRNNRIAKGIFQQHWIVYPLFVSLIFSLVSFPNGIGKYTSGRLKFSNNLRDFFANCTFSEEIGSENACGDEISPHWRQGAVILALVLFLIFHFLFSVVCVTLPVPCGIFMPIFVVGASTGRLMGELVFLLLSKQFHIYPGVYAVVGAASFSAAVTHSVSVSVMIFEITGQLHFILPVVIAVVVSNAVCQYLQPSFFDTIIKIKHLPFLPDIPPTKSVVHTTYAADVMVSAVKAIPRRTTYAQLRSLLIEGASIRIFPVIDNEENQMLVGTVSRRYLLELLERQVGDYARKVEAERRVKKAIELIDEHYQQSKNQLTRAKSESSLGLSQILETENGIRQRAKEAEEASKGGRFLVVPVSTSSVSPRRNAFCSIRSVPSIGTVSIASNEEESEKRKQYPDVVKNYFRQAKKYLHFHNNKKENCDYVPFDLPEAQRASWEEQRLLETLELQDEDIDPSPFQLTLKTSLYRIHTVFSMLQLAKAYVTDCGRLVGVVALSDLRQALERSEEAVVVEEKTETGQMDVEALRTLTTTPEVLDILTPTLEVIKPTSQVSLDASAVEAEAVQRRKSVSKQPAAEAETRPADESRPQSDIKKRKYSTDLRSLNGLRFIHIGRRTIQLVTFPALRLLPKMCHGFYCGPGEGYYYVAPISVPPPLPVVPILPPVVPLPTLALLPAGYGCYDSCYDPCWY